MRIGLKIPIFAGLLLLGALSVQAQSPPPLEAYGALPSVDLAELSPSGNRVAIRFTDEEKDIVMVIDLASGQFVTGANAEKVKPRWLEFVNDKHLIMVASETTRTGIVGRSYEYSAAHTLNIASSEVRTLLQRASNLYPHQAGLGRIVGRSPDRQAVYMPAYTNSRLRSKPDHSLFTVRLDKSSERLLARGTEHTIDWFVDQNGKPLIREDFDDTRNIHRIWVVDEDGEEKRLLHEEETERVSLGLVGLTADRGALVILSGSKEIGVVSYYLMSVEDGSVSGPVLQREDLGIERVVVDINRVVLGVEYEGFYPKYALFDNELNQRVEEIQERLPGTSARMVSWSEDFSKLLIRVSGGWNSGAYLLFEKGVDQPKSLSAARPAITKDQVAKTAVIEYQAQDGLTIPALITTPKGVADNVAAPLIVLPHGGPEAHDRFEFDWLSQYFASRGYLVLQPQFRGSTGFGMEFLRAGHGAFGGKMLSDVDDGVKHLIKAGKADPERVCILGASYGGYAALAAGAFSPDLYRCIVAIAPVSDLRKMLKQLKSHRGSKNWLIDYWETLYGAEASEKEILESISPSLHAASFQSPVLLVHGKKDTVVPIEQSKIMQKALKKAGKDVSFVELKGEDHWLSMAETRTETLRVIAEFIDQNL